jgi:hypothetical protein
MAISTWPNNPGSTSTVKNVQRGEALAAGNITITAVDTSKTRVSSFSTSATGTISIAGATVASADITSSGYTANYGTSGGTSTSLSQSMAAAALSGGTTDLSTAHYGVYLSDSTTLVATGPCRWEVVEYY